MNILNILIAVVISYLKPCYNYSLVGFHNCGTEDTQTAKKKINVPVTSSFLRGLTLWGTRLGTLWVLGTRTRIGVFLWASAFWGDALSLLKPDLYRSSPALAYATGDTHIWAAIALHPVGLTGSCFKHPNDTDRSQLSFWAAWITNTPNYKWEINPSPFSLLFKQTVHKTIPTCSLRQKSSLFFSGETPIY